MKKVKLLLILIAFISGYFLAVYNIDWGPNSPFSEFLAEPDLKELGEIQWMLSDGVFGDPEDPVEIPDSVEFPFEFNFPMNFAYDFQEYFTIKVKKQNRLLNAVILLGMLLLGIISELLIKELQKLIKKKVKKVQLRKLVVDTFSQPRSLIAFLAVIPLYLLVLDKSEMQMTNNTTIYTAYITGFSWASLCGFFKDDEKKTPPGSEEASK